MNLKKTIICSLGVAALALFSIQPAMAADEVSSAGTKVGVLTCKSVPESGVNLIIHSTVDVTCTFESTAGGSVEKYKGETGVGLGIDLEFDSKETLVYSVLSADFKAGSYQLAGKYGGVGASAALGLGAGVQVLVGGNKRSISLNPLALSGSEGVGVAAGLTYLYLEPAK